MEAQAAKENTQAGSEATNRLYSRPDYSLSARSYSRILRLLHHSPLSIFVPTEWSGVKERIMNTSGLRPNKRPRASRLKPSSCIKCCSMARLLSSSNDFLSLSRG